MTLVTESIKLANSIVYKSKLIAIDDLKRNQKYGFHKEIITDQTSYLYYKNLVSEEHDYNVEMVYIDPNGLSTIINKDSLLADSRLRANYTFNSTIYNSLTFKYPNNITLIKSLLYVGKYTINDLINMEDGDILYYDPTLIEWNEVSLIKELTIGLKAFLKTYSNPNFIITDENYVTGLTIAIEHFLIQKIIEIRLSKQASYEANSFFQISKLNSHLYVGSLVTFLTKESKLWLYRNIDDIVYNIGKYDNLKYVVEKLIEPNGYKVGIVNSNNMRLLPYYDGNNVRGSKIKEPLDITNIRTGELIDVISIDKLYRVLQDNYDFKHHKERLNLDKDMSVLTRGYEEFTKYLYLDNDSTNIPSLIAHEEVMIPTVIKVLSMNLDRPYVLNTNSQSLKLIGEDVLDIFLYCLFVIKGRNLTTVSSVINNILFDVSNMTTNEIENVEILDIDDKDVIQPIIDSLVSLQTLELETNSDIDYIGNYIDEQMNIVNRLAITISSINNVIHKGGWRVVMSRLFDSSEIVDISNVSDTNFKTVIDRTSLNVDLVDTLKEWYSIFDDIVVLITGRTLEQTTQKADELSLQSQLINRLTSYTNIIIYDKPKNLYYLKADDSSIVYDTGIIKVSGLTYDCIGDVVNIERAVGNDSKPTVYYVNTPTVEIDISKPSILLSIEQTKPNVINTNFKLGVQVEIV